jgi:predicted enzyme related to lactoylglutathione lyase
LTIFKRQKEGKEKLMTTFPQFNHIDLIVSDVPSAAAFFHEVLNLPLVVSEERFAQLESGAVTIMLSPGALVDVEPARGVILHFQVENVSGALEDARQKGAEVLRETELTPWGWESALIKGPEGIVVDVFRPKATP